MVGDQKGGFFWAVERPRRDRVQKLSRPNGGCESWQSLLWPDIVGIN